MVQSLKTKLSIVIVFCMLITVTLISISSNYFIDKKFEKYIMENHVKNISEIVNTIQNQYVPETGEWNANYVHAIGMDAINDGYIVKVMDSNNNTIWDAETCDMNMCMETMEDISRRMAAEYPELEGEITSQNFPLEYDGENIGTVKISYYGPYFLSESQILFINELNKILLIIGLLSLILSVFVGFFIAKRISKPILESADAAKEISNGKYNIRINEKTDTKEINELINAINHLADSLEKQEMLRKQLTADIAHELRTPLTILQTHLEMIIENIWEPSNDRLISCHDEIVRLSKLVNDLENIAKVENDTFKLDKKEVEIFKIISKVLEDFRLDFENKNINVFLNGNCQNIMGDNDKIKQIIINLLSNAIKYTNNGGDIYICISENENYVVVSVKDNGIGIPEEELPFIFERFYRADKSRNRLTGGAGIGLSIVKTLVEAHNGSVNVNSVLNKGTEFVVELPK